MLLNADFSRRVVLDTSKLPWVPSPMPGVERRMLDRVGEEVARATSLVRYAPGSIFKEHVHGGGEEFLVLEGIFKDEHGSYPKGTYVRNPVGSRHSPQVPEGCLILVKLRQMSAEDQEFVRIDMDANEDWRTLEQASGVQFLQLHEFGTELVRVLRLKECAEENEKMYVNGREIFVLEGIVEDDGGSYSKGCWIRLPPGAIHKMNSKTGALVWTKEGHLSE